VARADGRKPRIFEKVTEGSSDRVVVVHDENQRTSRFLQRGRVAAFGVALAHDNAAAGTTVAREEKPRQVVGARLARVRGSLRVRTAGRRRPATVAAASNVVVRVVSVAVARTNRLAQSRN
jgi:NADPH-dependent 2,4-dienoyl-CoA reductase/sulfur reductase-like enzyme